MKSLTKWSMTAGCCMLLGGFSGCDRLFDEKEQPEGSYTISGRLYKGTSDVPYANAALFLEGFQQQGFSNDYVDLGTAVTDESGYFSITYDRVFKDGKIGDGSEITLWFDQDIGGHIQTFPWHKDINRDFAEQNHSRVHVEVSFISNIPDTFFLEVESPISGDYLTTIELPEVYDGLVKSILAVPTNGQSYISFSAKLAVAITYPFAGFESGYAYGTSWKNIRQTMLFNAIDSVENNGQRGPLTIHGFPVTDTIKLEL